MLLTWYGHLSHAKTCHWQGQALALNQGVAIDAGPLRAARLCRLGARLLDTRHRLLQLRAEGLRLRNQLTQQRVIKLRPPILQRARLTTVRQRRDPSRWRLLGLLDCVLRNRGHGTADQACNDCRAQQRQAVSL